MIKAGFDADDAGFLGIVVRGYFPELSSLSSSIVMISFVRFVGRGRGSSPVKSMTVAAAANLPTSF